MFKLEEYIKSYKNEYGERINYRILYPTNCDINMIITLLDIRNEYNFELPSLDLFVKYYIKHMDRHAVIYYSGDNIMWFEKQYNTYPKEIKEFLHNSNKITNTVEYYKEKEVYFTVDISEENLFYFILKYPNVFSENFSDKIRVEVMM